MTHAATRAHYQTLLAPIYRWMLGDFAAALARSRLELDTLGIGPAGSGARALDLGAGLGLQAIPLHELGYRVTAVDSSDELLAELHRDCPAVSLVTGDLAELGRIATESYAVIVCMGDTLTHLASLEEVDAVLAAACAVLAPSGVLALTFRDYVAPVRESVDRFILVRADESRIHTCCLDYGVSHVRVTDLLHERNAGTWALRASAYDKVRLAHGWVAERLRAHGADSVRAESSGGRITVVARGAARSER
ncbi:MAG TPA: methyltransferase domain-containing protein [Polyangiaceae bacterium]|nr:methyltransferase domain-containing protein [Polyangiaceae bacterium]